MRSIWAAARTRPILLVTVVAIIVLAGATTLIVTLGGGASSALEPTSIPTPAEASRPAKPRATTTPTPTPSSTPAPAPVEAAPAPAPGPAPDQASAPEPAPAPAPEPAGWPPPAGASEFGWVGGGYYVQCPDMSGSQVVKDFYWTAPHATTVELYVAITNRDAQATDGYALVASVQGPSGVAGVPITCGAGTSYTIKILTMNAAGSAATHMWGGIGL